jgi:hypothetical protein
MADDSVGRRVGELVSSARCVKFVIAPLQTRRT